MCERTDGLTTEQGLQKLHEEIEKLIDGHNERIRTRPWTRLLFHLHRNSSCYTVLSVLFVLVMGLLLLISAGIANDERFYSGTTAWLGIEAFFIFSSLVLNLLLVYVRHKTFDSGLSGLKKNILEQINECICSKYPPSGCYPDLHAPLSPCISLQWCVRDGKVVNIPKALLVKNDVIVMRPGFLAPELCQSLQDGKVLQADEMYLKEFSSNEGTGPQPRSPLTTERFLLRETPILKNLRLMLDNKIKQPLSFVENERITICNVWLERRVLPLVFVVFLVINTVRYFHIDPDGAHWTEMLLLLQVHGVLPLVSVMFQLMWISVNTYGQAHIYAVCEVYRSLRSNPDSIESLGSYSDISVEEALAGILYKQVFKTFLSVMFGLRPTPCPNFEMLHTFGSVTAFCCIDKKGILSWPNASPEKIFFFSSNNKNNSSKEEEGEVKTSKRGSHSKKKTKAKTERNHGSKIEVLDLTHEQGKDGIEFDDPNWKHHLSALKPLGLASLLNTCNEDTVEWYTQFTDHVSCAAIDNKDTVAVVNRRCMCHLSQEIGFTDEAVNIFSHEATFGVYRQVPIEESEKEKMNRARFFIQHKIPMPNQVSVLIKDKLSGMCQLLTQGTGDVVLDCCCDVWTGSDLQILTEVDRKKILDFYHRNSMIAYCTAFAYKPIPRAVSDWSSDVYTELMESPNTTKQSHGEDMGVFLEHEQTDYDQRQRSHSMDSLIDLSPTNSVENLAIGQMLQSHQTFIGMASLQYQARQEYVQLIDKLESACIRFVHFSKENEVRSRIFSEKLGLEAGWNCHVSLMARESVASANSSCRNIPSLSNVHATTNCDAAGETTKGKTQETTSINISSPTSVPRTHSAPSFINVEEIQVKFARDPLPIVINEEEQCSDHNYSLADAPEETQRLIDRPPNIKEASQHEHYHRKDGDENNSRDGDKQHLLSFKDKESWSRRIEDSDSNSSDEDEDDDEEDGDFDVQSTSHYTSSYITEFTEDSLTGALDNRAHLPRGIENIRPHLQCVDNVPLLVNLFTDCTPQAMCEMVKIMQEYGEVVLIMGSCLNMENTSVFVQADCSIAIEPLFPKLCARREHKDTSSLISLASNLLSLPCAFYTHSHENIKFIQLIMEARHYVFAMRNCFYLMLCCLLATVLAQLVCSVILLPPLMSAHHIIWLTVIVIPALCLSLMGNPNEVRTMTMATHKNLPHVNKQIIVEFIVQFSARFIPSLLVAVVCFVLILHSFCENVSTIRCSLYDFSSSKTEFNVSSPVRWTDKFQGSLVLAQNIFHFLFVFYLVIISMSLVHWQDQFWQRLPFKNIVWSVTSCLIIVLQVIFSVTDVYIRQDSFGQTLSLNHVHPAVWVVGCVWPFCAIGLNEIVKKRAINLAVRKQKRARLDFDTKLGMNSPF